MRHHVHSHIIYPQQTQSVQEYVALLTTIFLEEAPRVLDYYPPAPFIGTVSLLSIPPFHSISLPVSTVLLYLFSLSVSPLRLALPQSFWDPSPSLLQSLSHVFCFLSLSLKVTSDHWWVSWEQITSSLVLTGKKKQINMKHIALTRLHFLSPRHPPFPLPLTFPFLPLSLLYPSSSFSLSLPLFPLSFRKVLTSISKSNEHDVWAYYFDHPLSFDAWGPNYTFCLGHVCHGAELPFVFVSAFVSFRFVFHFHLCRFFCGFFWKHILPFFPYFINTLIFSP